MPIVGGGHRTQHTSQNDTNTFWSSLACYIKLRVHFPTGIDVQIWKLAEVRST